MSEEIKDNAIENEKPTVEGPENKPTEETKEPEEKLLRQSEVDQLVGERIARERKKYADYDDIKQKAAQYEKEAEERRLAELSEKERAEELAKKFEGEKQTLEEQLAQLKATNEREKVHNEFIKASPSVGIPSDRIDAALKLADLSAVKVEDGKVSGLDDVMKSLVEQYSFLIAKKPEAKAIGDETNAAESGEIKTLEQQLEDAKQKKDFNKVIEISNKIKQFLKKGGQ